MPELLAASAAPDVAVIAASVDAGTVADIAIELIRAGAAVITTNGELFAGEGPDWDRIDEEARKAGVAFTASGVQDLLYVRLPMLYAGSTHNLTLVRVESHVDTSSFSKESGEQDAGQGLSEEDFATWSAEMYSIQGGPLRQVARALGFTPLPEQFSIEPLRSEKTLHWTETGRDLAPGEIVGSEALTVVDTEEGVRFEGLLRWKLNEGEELGNFYRVVGDTEVSGWHNDSDSHFLLTDVAIARRVPDILAARPGAIPVADLGLLGYTHPVSPSA